MCVHSHKAAHQVQVARALVLQQIRTYWQNAAGTLLTAFHIIRRLRWPKIGSQRLWCHQESTMPQPTLRRVSLSMNWDTRLTFTASDRGVASCAAHGLPCNMPSHRPSPSRDSPALAVTACTLCRYKLLSRPVTGTWVDKAALIDQNASNFEVRADQFAALTLADMAVGNGVFCMLVAQSSTFGVTMHLSFSPSLSAEVKVYLSTR